MSSAPHRVAVLVYDGVKMLDVAGPAEVFGEANQLGADYRVRLVSPSGADVTSSIGMRIVVDGGSAAEPDSGTFLLPGGDVYPRTPVTRDLINATQDLAGRAGRVASVCSGAFVLGAAGLLDGKRATTHWKITAELATRCPRTRVEPDALYVRDGTTYTSAGVTAGIDLALALALVEEDHGPDLSRQVARSMVVYLQRAGGQSQFSAPLTLLARSIQIRSEHRVDQRLIGIQAGPARPRLLPGLRPDRLQRGLHRAKSDSVLTHQGPVRHPCPSVTADRRVQVDLGFRWRHRSLIPQSTSMLPPQPLKRCQNSQTSPSGETRRSRP
ncbi:AraC family transcriptional regulator [Streptomyces sp. NPDC048171]|uniref:AraC family transcriptional regulator n=1 Tax=Streptomyces sp. NPDC048171 TaxID=3365504 RepID=UPI003715B891